MYYSLTTCPSPSLEPCTYLGSPSFTVLGHLTHCLWCFSACTSLSPCSRIYEILPQRIQQWQQSPCIAEEHGKKLLERIRREQQSARTRLQEMERRFHELEAIILRAKQQAVREDEEVKKRPSGQAPVDVLPGLIILPTSAEQRE